jgi:hypothetical protein
MFGGGVDGNAQGRLMCKANGAVVMYTTSNNLPGGTGVTVYCGPDKIQLANQYGGISIDATGITISIGGAALTLTPANGGTAKLTGSVVQGQASGMALFSGPAPSPANGLMPCTIIGPAAILTPVAGVSSPILGLTGVAGKPSASVAISQ